MAILQTVFVPKIFQLFKDAGAKTIFEVDDLMEWTSKHHPHHKDMTWKRVLMTWRAIHKADLVLTPSKYLAKRYGWLNRNVEWFPNLLDLSYWEKPFNPNISGTVRVGWAGSLSHIEDMNFIEPILAKVFSRYSAKEISFIHCGLGGVQGENKLAKLTYGEDIFPNIPEEKKEYVLGSSSSMWASKLNSMQFDIGIAPVVKNAFSQSKSWCKYLEYGINHYPGVYSKFLYQDVVKHGITGFLAETAQDWEQYLYLLIENRSLRKQMGEAAYQDVKNNHNIKNHLDRYEKICLNLTKDIKKL